MIELLLTAAEVANLPTEGTFWIVREGEDCATPHSCPKFTRQMCRWGGNHPPAEFAAACAPCGNPTHRIGHKSGLPECRNPSELGPGMHVNTYSFVPCVTCRIELVGPCPECQTLPAPGHCTSPVILGHAYAVGQPQQTDDGKWAVELRKEAQ